MESNKGMFIISIDYELMWGAIFNQSVRNGYEQRVPEVNKIIPQLLKLFEKYSIHATWAVVGAIGCHNKAEALTFASEQIKDPYSEQTLKDFINNTEDNIDYYIPSSIEQIANTDGQFIGSHTFSHFYVYEHNNIEKKLDEDLLSSKKILSKFQSPIQTVIFPKNQINEQALKVAEKNGFIIYRGRQHSKRFNSKSKLGRIMRFLDAYLPICGDNTFSHTEVCEVNRYNVRASRFLRTYYNKLAIFEELKLRRIKAEMTKAAKKGKIYHIWWHPHNFSTNVEHNLKQLEQILVHFRYLNEEYGFISNSMEECANYAGQRKKI
jgi:peptidoglycan/xylan/chitin deacetylase (PgdA/CDA1 family)